MLKTYIHIHTHPYSRTFMTNDAGCLVSSGIEARVPPWAGNPELQQCKTRNGYCTEFDHESILDSNKFKGISSLRRTSSIILSLPKDRAKDIILTHRPRMSTRVCGTWMRWDGIEIGMGMGIGIDR